MKSYLVVLDGTPISWEAAYSAFHLAARLGSRLIGLASESPAGERTASQWLAEFETGARAAGIAVESRLVPHLDAETLGAQANTTDGVFWGYSAGTSDDDMLTELLASLQCSLWLVPRQTSVRKIVDIPSDPSSGRHSSHFAKLLSRRLGVDLVTIRLSELHPVDGRIPSEHILDRIGEIEPDLLILDRGERTLPLPELSLSPPCLTVFLAS
jgi:nucleotide-binding universal stress UspA family protein